MQRNLRTLLTALLTFAASSPLHAGPWFTGPILAPAGRTMPLGDLNLETYYFYTDIEGVYTRHWKFVHTPGNDTQIVNPLISYGLASRVDVQLSLPYVINKNMSVTSQHIGDVGVTMGFQALEQKNSRWMPNLRIALQEIFPTGRYHRLNPMNFGTDATGQGTYGTAISFNFEHLLPFNSIHYLRSRLSFNYLYEHSLHVDGLNSYGGSLLTNGQVKPGDNMSIDLAGEFTMTQHWVAVMEGFYLHQGTGRFTGVPGFKANGKLAKVGHPATHEMTLAPALEYNFSEHYGIIAGSWFSLETRSAKFISTVVAFNAFW